MIGSPNQNSILFFDFGNRTTKWLGQFSKFVATHVNYFPFFRSAPRDKMPYNYLQRRLKVRQDVFGFSGKILLDVQGVPSRSETFRYAVPQVMLSLVMF